MPLLDRYPDLQLQLHLSHFDPALAYDSPEGLDARVHLAIARLSLEHLDAIYIYGLAEGRPFLELQEWLEAVSGRQLIFLEENLYAIHRLSSLEWGERLLQHPQVHLRFLASQRDEILEECAKQFPLERVAVITMEGASASFRAVKLALLRKTVLWNSLTSEVLSGHLLHRNILSNFQKLPSAFYVNRTRNDFAGLPAVICGAGPSLSGAAAELKIIRDQVVLIGCGSALSALSHMEVRPHLGVAIDPNAQEKECLKGCQWKDLPLIYGNRLYPGVFDLFEGPYGYLRSPTGSPLEKAIEQQLGLTEADIGLDLGREALSVTTLALALACFWGCSPIILAGVDLAYMKGTHYAPGVPVHLTQRKKETRAGEQSVYRKGMQGKRVATLVKWVMERQTIDAYTKMYPHITFMNATGQGLGFSHIPHRNWEEIKPFLSHGQAVDSAIKKMIGEHPMGLTADQLQEALAQFQGSFRKCLEFAKSLEHEIEGSGKAILYEEELSHEKAYQLTLKPALEVLERIYQLNIEIPFSQHRWKFLREMIEEYLKCFCEP